MHKIQPYTDNEVIVSKLFSFIPIFIILKDHPFILPHIPGLHSCTHTHTSIHEVHSTTHDLSNPISKFTSSINNMGIPN